MYRRKAGIALLIGLALGLGACAHGQVSVGVGMGMPGPWGSTMMVGTTMPVGRW
jgi:hypothetical protein